LLNKGLSTNRVIGSVYGTAWYFIWQADAHNQLGRSDLALDLLLKAEAVIEETGERFIEAELHFVWGALLSGRGETVAAEKHFREALELSRRRGARIYELNAATRLARLFKDSKREEARQLLASVYDWFTEGFDAPVLRDAEALLHELAQ
jgi:tetratricopeptide (TPR) repeat protein